MSPWINLLQPIPELLPKTQTPQVVCFWGNNAEVLRKQCAPAIQRLKNAQALPLVQLTWDIQEQPSLITRLVNLVGPQAIRLHLDLIPGVTTPIKLTEACLCVMWHELNPRVTVDLRVANVERNWLVKTMRRMVEMAAVWEQQLVMAAPADFPGLHKAVPGLCQPDDLAWALSLRPDLGPQLQGCKPLNLPN
ncbi:MAG: hypothetical protein BWY63_00731 [Chloroflexi bacterium ADurb.Bin360]|nr:MAG: hypothetical protein BWY63_00731 [Chloroflexi bacterium ADurb.Bin360]